jgi:hypothetical protein
LVLLETLRLKTRAIFQVIVVTIPADPPGELGGGWNIIPLQ